ncbi:UDP-N-acetyl-D-mannosamine dehydrogenase [Arthrobacter sp. ISL-72]|nr:UDP-N-acetyl-D-mannosamine dehydrogenase [Arthrobacter sp. ISL-72]
MEERTPRPEKIVVVGLGYIGLPTAAALAVGGHVVVGVDLNEATVESVARGQVPFVEPDLQETLAQAISLGRLTTSTTIPPADVYILAVPTPYLEDHTADLSYVEAASRQVAAACRGGELVILESTCPPGATQFVADVFSETRPDLAVNNENSSSAMQFVHCPERVLPGRIMIEIKTNARIIGGLTTSAAERAKRIYESFCSGPIRLTDAKTAEMAKLVENSFRDVNIAFANELSLICETLKINVWELIELANQHPRVNILQPGPGVGGHCIAVDPWFIVASDPINSNLIRTAREVNDRKPAFVVQQLMNAVEEKAVPVVAILGLAFKANIDDLRESPAVEILRRALDVVPGIEFYVAEPHISTLPHDLVNEGRVELVETAVALDKSNIVVALVDHDEFQMISTDDLSGKTLIDSKGIFNNLVPAV